MKSNEDIAFHHVNDCVTLPLSYLLATQVTTYQTPPNQIYLPRNSMIDLPFVHHDLQMKKNANISFPLELFTQATYNAQMKIIATTQNKYCLHQTITSFHFHTY
jgi:histidinol phosphatase-like enzyme